MKNQKGVSLITLIITIIVVIILAIIILRSGVSNTPDQAAFSGFTKDMGELQDNVKLAMLSAKGDEAIRGNNRSEAQLYNFVARGGYAAISGDEEGDKKWLIQADARDIPCTLINKLHAEDSIGMDLPVITVETAKGTNQEVSFFVTPKGNVFCWPPYLYDNNSYVTADYALDMEKVSATEAGKTVTLEFDNGEIVKVSNLALKAGSDETAVTESFTRTEGASASGDVAVWYGDDNRATANTYRGVAGGYTFHTYDNTKAQTDGE